MLSRGFLIAIVAAAAVASALGTDHIVGDGAGWTLSGPNYTLWAQSIHFRVGDTLTFVYSPGAHNVLEVNRADSEGCTSSDPAAVPYISGNDTVLLIDPGEKWYICDIGNHCFEGMKLGITVSAAIDGPPGYVTGSSNVEKMSPLIFLLIAAYWMIICFMIET